MHFGGTDTSNPVVAWIRGSCLVVGGAVVIWLAALELSSIQDFVAQAHRAEGTVVALNAGTAHPEVRFEEPDRGEPVSFPGNGFGVSHRVGDRVRVLYLREGRVLDARLDEPSPLWGFALMTVGTGAVLLIGGGYTLLRAYRARSEGP